MRINGGRLLLDIKASPGASKTEFAGLQGERLRIRVAAAPEDGKANEELAGFLSKVLGCAKRDIVLESGEKSRLKTLGLPASCAAALAAAAGLTQGQAPSGTGQNSRRQNTQTKPA
ncbi:MAG: DUF167 domain-containing protein [Treponema sp.]|jgi:uncharacterized protein (TIGR00251 family)|nr:DUF167 domain-containing protein [Treponema sp.]